MRHLRWELGLAGAILLGLGSTRPVAGPATILAIVSVRLLAVMLVVLLNLIIAPSRVEV